MALVMPGVSAQDVASTPPIDELLDLSFHDVLQIRIESAGKREEQISDIPASVSIVTRDEIERYGWRTLEEVLRNTPGFYMLDNVEERFIGTRGTVGGGVQFLVNGITQHPSIQKTLTVPEIARLNIPVEAIDRIEIIRGPMSVIYGNNAFMGVVNIVTNDHVTAGSLASASIGNRGNQALFTRIAKANTEGFLTINVGGRRDDGLDGAYEDMMDSAQLTSLDPSMHRSMDGDVGQQEASMDLSAGWKELSTNLRLSHRDYGFYAFTPSFDDGNRVRLDTIHLSLEWEHRISDALAVRTTGIYSQENYNAYQLDFISESLGGNQDQSSQRQGLEFNLLWQPERSIDTLFGYRIESISDVRNNPQAGDPNFTLIDMMIRLDDYTTQDLFTEIGWQIDDSWRLTGGARLTRLSSSYNIVQNDILTGIVTQWEARPEDNTELNGRLAVLWNPSPKQVIKLIWGTASQDSGDPSFAEPERIRSLELNTTFTRAHWWLSTSLFQNNISSIVRTIQRLNPDTGLYESVDDNSGRWRTRGLELILDLHPMEKLHFSAALTWQCTEDVENNIEPGYSPNLLSKIRADWRQDAWTYAAYAHYTGAMEADWNFIDGTNQGVIERIGERVPGYWNLGVNLRWDHPNNRLYTMLNVSNLLDTEIRYPANEFTDFYHGLIGPGRIATLSLGYTF